MRKTDIEEFMVTHFKLSRDAKTNVLCYQYVEPDDLRKIISKTIKYIEAVPSRIHQYRRVQRIADKRKHRIRLIENDLRLIISELESIIYENPIHNEQKIFLIDTIKKRNGFT